MTRHLCATKGCTNEVNCRGDLCQDCAPPEPKGCKHECKRFKEDERGNLNCELGMWGQMFGWCSHYKKRTESDEFHN